jgi:hypothetical protein
MGLLNKLHIPYGKFQPAVRQLIQMGMSNAEIAKALERSVTHIAKERSLFNAIQPVGERWSTKGYKFGLPLVGAPMMQQRDD